MSYLQKPKVHHPQLKKNELGLTRRDYEGGISTLCAGCGHDSVTAAIIQAAWELSIQPHTIAKMSGIGCSSKTPGYFMNTAHGFNSVHGRMPSVTTGAAAANRNMVYLGVSGDGDTASIGLGQFAHAMRRRLKMLYIIENNGVYGLTKGQFSATADFGSLSKQGRPNPYMHIDPVLYALQMGASFVARSFSGDKHQLVPLIKAGLNHQGFALIDVISPCVTFNNHEGSTKSYEYVRQHEEEVTAIDFVPRREELTTAYEPGALADVTLHDGSTLRLKKLDHSYDPYDSVRAAAYVQTHQAEGQVVTGLIYVDDKIGDMHEILGTVGQPLRDLAYSELCPGGEALAKLNGGWR